MDTSNKIALFIDADNAPASKIKLVMDELALHGAVNIRKAYGNWKNNALQKWEALLHEFAIQPVQQFDLTKGKNATDIALTIDVMDTLYTKDVDVICLMSSDCDFTPLVNRALADGKIVMGCGERKTPAAFVNGCTQFLFLDDEPPEAKKAVSQTKKIKHDTRLIKLLREAIKAAEEKNGWARLGPIGSHISNHQSLSKSDYGFKKLSDLFAAIDLFEMKKTGGSAIWVRDKRRC